MKLLNFKKNSAMGKNTHKFFFLIFSFFWSYYAAKHFLNQGDRLDASDGLVSRNGFFTLNFSSFYPDDEWYLGIWYKNDLKKPCWLANRDEPIKSGQGVLLIHEEGSLTITNTSGNPIKLHSGGSKTNLTAILQNDGNFVLREETCGKILWESFDSPTSAYLQGMKLGINHKTGQKWSLTSWLNDAEPIPGAFKSDPSEKQLIIKRRGVKLWSSGELNNGSFRNLVTFGELFGYNFTQHSNEDEDYLTLHLMRDERFPGTMVYENVFSEENVTSLSLEPDGTWLRQNSTGGSFPMYEVCDGSSAVRRCERWKGPDCRTNNDAFHKKEMIIDDSVRHSVPHISISDCKDMCWNDCQLCWSFNFRH